MENFVRYGRITVCGQVRQGTSSRGEWKTQSFVIEEVNVNYPRKMCFDVFGEERLKDFNIEAGKLYKVKFDIDAHEYQGKWFNQIRAFDVRPWDGQAQTTDQAQAENATEAPQTAPTAPANNQDPFGPVNPDPLPFG